MIWNGRCKRMAWTMFYIVFFQRANTFLTCFTLSTLSPAAMTHFVSIKPFSIFQSVWVSQSCEIIVLYLKSGLLSSPHRYRCLRKKQTPKTYANTFQHQFFRIIISGLYIPHVRSSLPSLQSSSPLHSNEAETHRLFEHRNAPCEHVVQLNSSLLSPQSSTPSHRAVSSTHRNSPQGKDPLWHDGPVKIERPNAKQMRNTITWDITCQSADEATESPTIPKFWRINAEGAQLIVCTMGMTSLTSVAAAFQIQQIQQIDKCWVGKWVNKRRLKSVNNQMWDLYGATDSTLKVDIYSYAKWLTLTVTLLKLLGTSGEWISKLMW